MNDQTALYELEEIIDKAVKALSDNDIYFAYWLNYENDGGYLESLIRQEYLNRHLGEADK